MAAGGQPQLKPISKMQSTVLTTHSQPQTKPGFSVLPFKANTSHIVENVTEAEKCSFGATLGVTK